MVKTSHLSNVWMTKMRDSNLLRNAFSGLQKWTNYKWEGSLPGQGYRGDSIVIKKQLLHSASGSCKTLRDSFDFVIEICNKAESIMFAGGGLDVEEVAYVAFAGPMLDL